MAVRLADLAAKGGHRVTLGSRSPKRAESIAGKLCTTGNVHGGSYDDAVACDIVMPAIFIRDGAFDQLLPLADAVKGKIVVDILNPFRSDEHTSELQSLMRISYAVYCLKKKRTT